MSISAPTSSHLQTPTLPPLTVQLDPATITAIADAVAERIVAQVPVPGDRLDAGDPWLTSSEAADYLKLPSTNALHKLTSRGELRSEDRGRKGARLRIRKSWCDAWLEGAG